MSGGFLAIARQAGAPLDPGEHRKLTNKLTARGWRIGLRRPEVEVWSHGARAPEVRWIDDLQAAVVGRLWTRDDAGPRSSRPAPTGGLAEARAARLCASHWGRYVALLVGPRGGEASVFRDPSGAIDALTWTRGAWRLAANTIVELPPDLLPPGLALDWNVISDFICRPVSLNGPTALRGLEAVIPGTVQPLGAPSAEATVIWQPADFLPAPGAEVDRTADLTRVVVEAVREDVDPHGRVIAEVSGGLDSAIVCACATHAGLGPRITYALNYVGDRAEGDERDYAVALCERLGLPLESAPRALCACDPARDFAPLCRDARPPVNALDPWRDHDTARRLRLAEADALLTGGGGDPAFFQLPTPLIFADLWRERGMRAGLDPLLGDLSRVLRRSAWSVARDAAAALRRPRAVALDTHQTFAGPRALAANVDDAAHPWLSGLAAAPPGKALQIAALTATRPTLGPSLRSAAAEVLQPLLAQPVVELCLSIPTWVLARGGRDRALARAAFRAWLPDQIVERRSKGLLTSFYARGVNASLGALREHLLDGVLADAGVLDRRAMDLALRPERLIWRADGLSLLRAAAIESWVRYWQARVPDAPEAARYRS